MIYITRTFSAGCRLYLERVCECIGDGVGIYSRTFGADGDCVWSACVKGMWWGPGFIVFAVGWI